MKWEDWTSYYFTCDCVLESISRQNIELYMRYAKTRTEYLSNVLVPGFPLMFYWAAKEKTNVEPNKIAKLSDKYPFKFIPNSVRSPMIKDKTDIMSRLSMISIDR